MKYTGRCQHGLTPGAVLGELPRGPPAHGHPRQLARHTALGDAVILHRHSTLALAECCPWLPLPAIP
jgi:hypothetical protein